MRDSPSTVHDPEILDPVLQDNDIAEPREDQPLLHAPDEETWKPPRGFIWIQMAIMSNVFLYGLDSTITAATYAVISSEFDAANTASWLTTSYLITSTAFQPLYGRVSDIFGRRLCFFISTITFAIGCLGCAVANDIIILNIMRALSGFGGGGLMTMVIGALVVSDQAGGFSLDSSLGTVWRRVDFSGSLLLVVAVSVQLVGLSLGGNELPWGSPWVIGSLIGSIGLFALFLLVEAKTSAIPVIPLRLLQGRLPIATQCANVCAGMAAYGYLFMLPLFFQVVLLDSATTAGARLAIPSLATPIGGLISGVVMSRWGKLLTLVRTGAFFMVLGNGLVTLLQFQDSKWKYFVYVFPANLGQGIIYPGILFTSLASFDHADHAVTASTVYLIRSLGTVWGVSVTSAIVQTTLSIRLPDALNEVPDKWTVIEKIRHSVDFIRELPPDVQLKARLVYYDGLRYAFGASTAVALLGLVAALVASGTGLRTTHK
ncbi:hypothetical protein ACHAP5_000964 [Fusarium lateritium]